MTTFDDRERGFEQKFAHDADLQFRVTARRNKLLGLWAAERLGLSGDAATSYAGEVVAADFDRPGDGDVIAKVTADLAGMGVTEAEVRAALEAQFVQARRQIMETL